MKRLYWCTCVLLLFTTLSFTEAQAQDPITLIIKEGVKKAIVAADLQIQRLQNRTIWLQNAQKVLENTMSKLQLEEIAHWTEKHRHIYQDYFDELWKAKALIAEYNKIRQILELQGQLVREYRRAWNGVRQDRHFTAEEVAYIGAVYTGILEESSKNLEEIALVVNSFITQMSDASRTQILRNAAAALSESYTHLRSFNAQNVALSLQRAKGEQDIAVTRRLYGVQ